MPMIGAVIFLACWAGIIYLILFSSEEEQDP